MKHLIAVALLLTSGYGYAENKDQKVQIAKDVLQLHSVMRETLDQGSMTVVVVVHGQVNGVRSNDALYLGVQRQWERILQRASNGSKRFSLVERERLDKILEESKLSYAGITEAGSEEIAKLLNVTHIAFVDLISLSMDTETKTNMYLKLVDVRNGRVILIQGAEIKS